jgi:hypothetical protein
MQENKDKILRSYIQDQMQASFVDKILNTDNIQIHGNVNSYCKANEATVPVSASVVPYDDDARDGQCQLDEFKNRVLLWMRLDNEIKELTNKIKMLDNERKQRKKYMQSLTPHILSYMNTNEIEELNSREGRLRYKASMVKTPLTQTYIKSQLYDRFKSNHDDLDKIFNDREKIQKVTLRRLTH